MKRIILLLILLAIAMSGCSGDSHLPQTEPGFGSCIVRMGIKNLGSIDIRLFDNDSPEAYNLFLEKIEEGCYTEASVSAVIKDYLLMVKASGIPEGTVAREDMKVSQLFEQKDESGIYPICGSVLVSDNFTADGSFMIISGTKENIKELEEMLNYKGITLSEYLLKAYGIKMTEEQLDLYRDEGGAPWLSGVYPCIGQVFGGMDLLDRILKETSIADSTYRPLDELVISGIEIIE